MGSRVRHDSHQVRAEKLSIDDLHKAFESRARLGIMSALDVNNELDFSSLKEFLGVTEGNLATHIKKLKKLEFVELEKFFIDNNPNTRYSIKLLYRLVFLMFFMIELLSGSTIHPVQYLLISFALLIFYTLLLSISEYIAFGSA